MTCTTFGGYCRVAFLALGTMMPLCAVAGTPVILDNDFLGPGGSNIQSLAYVLGRKDVDLLGITVVAGDGQEKIETAHVLSFLDLARHNDVPVYEGAYRPLLNTRAEWQSREYLYGPTGWHGAWGGFNALNDSPEPLDIRTVPEGLPTHAPAATSAAEFLVQASRRYQGELILIAGGPLTNIALAMTMDPEFVHNVRKIVFMGGEVNGNVIPNRDHASYSHDFNIRFDPEAAHLVLSAKWREIVAVSPPATQIPYKPAYSRCSNSDNPVSQYLTRYAQSFPMWDEITAAIALTPNLITSSSPLVLDAIYRDFSNYGYLVSRTSKGEQDRSSATVQVVYQINTHNFLKNYQKAVCKTVYDATR